MRRAACRRSASTSLPGQLVASSLTDLTTARALASSSAVYSLVAACHIAISFFPFFLLPATPPPTVLLVSYFTVGHAKMQSNVKPNRGASSLSQYSKPKRKIKSVVVFALCFPALALASTNRADPPLHSESDPINPSYLCTAAVHILAPKFSSGSSLLLGAAASL